LATTAAYLVSWLMPAARTSGNIPSFVDYLKSIAFMPHEALNGEIVPVLGVGWTLNYEMAFYLCCAAACAISIRHRAIWTTLLVALLALGSN
jgi:exopolysaccharide production protein ExoZ